MDKMNNQEMGLAPIIAMLIVGVFAIGGLVVLGSRIDNLEKEIEEIKVQAVEHGAAQYNPTNGIWEWK